MSSSMPNWVLDGDGDSVDRLRQEVTAMESFPTFSYRVMEESGMMFAEGILELASGNSYCVRICFPEDFPESSPYSIIKEETVFETYLKGGIPHVHGISMDGVRIIPFLYQIEEGISVSGISMIYLTARWLSAYESWLQTGEFRHEACVHFDGEQFHVFPPQSQEKVL